MSVRQLDSTDIQARAAKIPCVLLDIDGLMTDCKLYLTPDGQEIKAVNVLHNEIKLPAYERIHGAQGLG